MKPKPNDLTVERLRALLSYDPVNGEFLWRINRGRTAKAGQVAGYVVRDGYRMIIIDGHIHLAHRLAWLHAYGSWPIDQIDHRSGYKDDNRLSNLRECDNSHNVANSPAPRRNKSGFKGVHWHKRNKKWVASARKAGQRGSGHIGYFSSAEEAALAARSARSRLFGEFAHD